MESFAGRKALVVERFDRQWAADGSWIMRIPQEDMCQATGTPPVRKYENEGGPGIETIMELLQGAVAPAQDRARLKNFSIRLLAGGRYEMTPLYEVLSAYPMLGNGAVQIAPQDAKLAMAVRGKNTHWHMGRIMRRNWNAMARRCGLGVSAEDLIESIIEKTPGVVAAVERSLPHDFPAVVAESILSGLISRVKRFAGMPAD